MNHMLKKTKLIICEKITFEKLNKNKNHMKINNSWGKNHMNKWIVKKNHGKKLCKKIMWKINYMQDKPQMNHMTKKKKIEIQWIMKKKSHLEIKMWKKSHCHK